MEKKTVKMIQIELIQFVWISFYDQPLEIVIKTPDVSQGDHKLCIRKKKPRILIWETKYFLYTYGLSDQRKRKPTEKFVERF